MALFSINATILYKASYQLGDRCKAASQQPQAARRINQGK